MAKKGIFAKIRGILSQTNNPEVAIEEKQDSVGEFSSPDIEPPPIFSGNSNQRRKKKREWLRQNNLQNSK